MPGTGMMSRFWLRPCSVFFTVLFITIAFQPCVAGSTGIPDNLSGDLVESFLLQNVSGPPAGPGAGTVQETAGPAGAGTGMFASVMQRTKTVTGWSGTSRRQVVGVKQDHRTKRMLVIPLSEFSDTVNQEIADGMDYSAEADSIILKIDFRNEAEILEPVKTLSAAITSGDSKEKHSVKTRAEQYKAVIASVSREIHAKNPSAKVGMYFDDVANLTDGLDLMTITADEPTRSADLDYRVQFSSAIAENLDFVIVDIDGTQTAVAPIVLAIAVVILAMILDTIIGMFIEIVVDTASWCACERYEECYCEEDFNCGAFAVYLYGAVKFVLTAGTSVILDAIKATAEEIAGQIVGYFAGPVLDPYTSPGNYWDSFTDDVADLEGLYPGILARAHDSMEEACLYGYNPMCGAIYQFWDTCLYPVILAKAQDRDIVRTEVRRQMEGSLGRMDIRWNIDRSTLRPGETATVTYTLSGDPAWGTSYDVNCRDVLPSGFTLAGGSTSAFFPAIGPGETESYSYTVRAGGQGVYSLHRNDIAYTIRFTYNGVTGSEDTTRAWYGGADVAITVNPDSCTGASDCAACQDCVGSRCTTSDLDPAGKCSGTCCGGACSGLAGDCCDSTYYAGSRTCCSAGDCGPNEDCIDHTCLKENYEACAASGECRSGNCAGCLDEERCCPAGMMWDGSNCVYSCGAAVSCPDTCHAGNPAVRFTDGRPYVEYGYDNNNDGVPEGSCPAGHNDVVDVTGDSAYDCCYARESCPADTPCSGGACTAGDPETCSGAGYTCCDACKTGTEHAEYSDCSSSNDVCCEECQFSGCNSACPASVSCDLITSQSYSTCCNPGDATCDYSVQQYTEDGWQTCGYEYAEPCCAAWKEESYCYSWQDDTCGGGDCPLGMMHQTRDCWGTSDCPESRCVERSSCEKSVAGYSDARVRTATFPTCTDAGTVNASCAYAGTFPVEFDGEIGDGKAQGNMVLGMDGNTLYNENTQNSAFNYWEPMSSGSKSNFIEARHEASYPSACYTGYVYYGGSCYRYRCDSGNEDCGVTIKSPTVAMTKPALKLPLTREQYYKSDVYPHVLWHAATSGADKLTADQMRAYAKASVLDPCKVTINGESYYSDSCLDSRCGLSNCLEEETAGFTLDIEPFFFAEEVSELQSPDLAPVSIAPTTPVIETQDAVVAVVVANKLDRYGFGVNATKSFFVDVYVNETFVGRRTVNGLLPGVTATLSYLINPTTAAGQLPLKVSVDPTNVVAEREEGNNWLIQNITVLPKTDIAVTGATVPSGTLYSGATVPVTVTLQNLGSSGTRDFVVALAAGSEFRNYNLTSLAGGENKAVTVNWTAVPGTHLLTVTADAVPSGGGVIPETNENNNAGSVTAAGVLKGTSAPVLAYASSDGFFFNGVEPDSGNTTRPFEYRIQYVDYDNDPPAAGSPRVLIDINGDGDTSDTIGSFTEGAFTMGPVDAGDTVYSDGKTYTFSAYLPDTATATYRFTAQDLTGLPARGLTGTFAGPRVSAACGSMPTDPLPGYTDLPTDPDGDCVFEDLNANGRKDFADVVLYFSQMSWIAENGPVAAFDLNHNGRIDFADIVALFNEI